MTATKHFSIQSGYCYAVFAYDIGTAIRLEDADHLITATKERKRFKRTRPTPDYFDYHPPPLRVTLESTPIPLANTATQPRVEVVLYDFGAVLVMYRLPLDGSFSHLLTLSEALYENPSLLEGSRKHVEQIQTAIYPAVEKPQISSFVEDYSIFHIEQHTPTITINELLAPHLQDFAQILRCEREPLSEGEVRDATAYAISFGTDDVTFIDWNAALVFGRDMDDVLAVLEFANVELLERRYLDQQLDNALDQAYDALSKKPATAFRWPGSYHIDLQRIAQLQVDSAILFERVTNTLKLLGDQYLARVYRLTSQRFHLIGWDTSILRKLETLESIYGKLADQTGNQRMEVLEWIIIILIAVSIILPFIPGFPGY